MASTYLSLIFVGIGLEICAAGLGTVSKQLIASSVQKRYLFHIGATLNLIVGPVVDASAYAFAPSVVVAPFACLDIIFNVLTAPYTLRWQNEKLTAYHALGTFLVALGACSTAVFGISDEEGASDVYELEALFLRPASLVYLITEGCAVILMMFLLKKHRLPPNIRGPALGVISGVLIGNVFCVKGFIRLVRWTISSGSGEAWIRPTPYLLLAGAALGGLGGHVFLKRGLAEYKGVFMVTIFEGAHVVAACLSGSVVLAEMAGLHWSHFVLYWCGVGIIISGMVVINVKASEAQMRARQAYSSFSSSCAERERISSMAANDMMMSSVGEIDAGLEASISSITDSVS